MDFGIARAVADSERHHDPDPGRHRHRAVPLPGAGPGPARRRPLRPVLHGVPALRAAHRTAAVRRASPRCRSPTSTSASRRQRPSLLRPGRPAGLRRGRPARAGQGPGGPLPERRGLPQRPARARLGRPVSAAAPGRWPRMSSVATACDAGRGAASRPGCDGRCDARRGMPRADAAGRPAATPPACRPSGATPMPSREARGSAPTSCSPSPSWRSSAAHPRGHEVPAQGHAHAAGQGARPPGHRRSSRRWPSRPSPRASCACSRTRRPSDKPVGEVISQSRTPAPRSTPARSINVDVSTGPGPVQVPDVSGQSVEQARVNLTGAPYSSSSPRRTRRRTTPPSTRVWSISTIPAAGQDAAPGSHDHPASSRRARSPSPTSPARCPAQADAAILRRGPDPVSIETTDVRRRRRARSSPRTATEGLLDRDAKVDLTVAIPVTPTQTTHRTPTADVDHEHADSRRPRAPATPTGTGTTGASAPTTR